MYFHNTLHFVRVSNECRIWIFAKAVKHQACTPPERPKFSVQVSAKVSATPGKFSVVVLHVLNHQQLAMRFALSIYGITVVIVYLLDKADAIYCNICRSTAIGAVH